MSRADRKKRRRERLEKDRRESFIKAITKTRLVGEEPYWNGSGELVLQISTFPSFERGNIWDFRIVDDQICLWASFTNVKRPKFLMPGYHKISEDQQFLGGIIEGLSKHQIRTQIAEPEHVIVIVQDGTTYCVRFNSGSSSICFTWSGEGPEDWKDFTRDALHAIKQLKEITSG